MSSVEQHFDFPPAGFLIFFTSFDVAEHLDVSHVVILLLCLYLLNHITGDEMKISSVRERKFPDTVRGSLVG
ncbi:MAG TPA: hypothetical protein DCP92_24410 [Nitrospiraceae bacterium]|nr:hypothetical protein [Nitrospiraceae bacterium]